jgi:hypothetical protein
MSKSKSKPRQLEVQWDKPEPFKLHVEQTTDGDRITREASQQQADRNESAKNQTRIQLHGAPI